MRRNPNLGRRSAGADQRGGNPRAMIRGAAFLRAAIDRVATRAKKRPWHLYVTLRRSGAGKNSLVKALHGARTAACAFRSRTPRGRRGRTRSDGRGLSFRDAGPIRGDGRAGDSREGPRIDNLYGTAWRGEIRLRDGQSSVEIDGRATARSGTPAHRGSLSIMRRRDARSRNAAGAAPLEAVIEPSARCGAGSDALEEFDFVVGK